MDRYNSRTLSGRWLLLFFASAFFFSAKADFVPAASREIELPGADIGEILIGELNCTACHAASDSASARLLSKRPPLLDDVGTRLSPQFIRALLNAPHQEKPGTGMPDLLQSMSDSARRETVDSLVHYLSTLRRSTAFPASFNSDRAQVDQGRRLYHQVGCVACHAPFIPPPTTAPGSGGNAGSQPYGPSMPLGRLAKKFTVFELARFLRDPLAVRPSGRMPSLNLTEDEATAIAVFLLRDQAPADSQRKIPGLKYEYFEGDFESATLKDARAIATGTVETVTLKPRRRIDNIGFRFFGTITIEKDGKYTFTTRSDDGSFLFIDNQRIVDNDGKRPVEEKQGTIDLKAGDHSFEVKYINGIGESELAAFIEGPDMARREISASMLSHSGFVLMPQAPEAFLVDAAKVERGRIAFQSLGCASCHGGSSTMKPAKPLNQLQAAANNGCLAEAASSKAPYFDLNPEQRAAIIKALNNQSRWNEPRSPTEEVNRLMVTFNCFACHSREGIGGPSVERASFFALNGEADLGDEGRMPPHLNRVGAKLRPEWTREVLTRHGAVRPYMAVRMPQFGEANIGKLADLFERADGSPLAEKGMEPDNTEAKFGRRLVGTSGFSCIACHNFAGRKSLGIPAMDLATASRRLKKDWFHRYLLNPQVLRPGTRMPSFFPDGKSVQADIFAGNADRQIDAIWSYLNQKQMELPPGLIQGQMELVATDEPIIYRNFIQGAGSRAIGVGYPEKANLAFDANELRLALIWHGAFIDAARHRTGRGEGYEPPLGNDVVRMPGGPSFAFLDDQEAPWPAAIGKEAGYQMNGYRLDAKRRPTFLYHFQDVKIEDALEPFPTELDPAFRRTIRFTAASPKNNLWFRAASGQSIEKRDERTFVVDGRIQLRFAGGGTPLIRKKGALTELIVPIRFSGNESTFTEEISW
jgi:mono/diheme cytochrome c family protein